MKIKFLSTKLFDKLYSIGFRFVLLFYALLILNFEENIFSIYLYTAVILVYSIIYYKNLFGNKYESLIRLINDFIFITLILFGKPFWEPKSLIFFLLPIFNFTNHTGKKPKWLPLIVVPTISFFVLNFQSEIKHLETIFLFSFYLVYSISFLRKKIEQKPIQQFEEIEKSVNAMKHFPDSFKLYPKLINQIKALNFTFCDFKNYDSVLCIEIRNNRNPRILNASEIFYDFYINPSDLKFEKDNELASFIESLEVRLNNEEYPYSLAIKPNAGNNLLFIFPTKIPPTFFLQNRYLIEILTPVLERFSRVIEFEQFYRRSKRRNLKEIKDKLLFIRKAEKAMHFLKNKLSPLANLIAVLKEQHIEKEKVIYDDDNLKEFISKEIKKSDSNLKKVIGRASIILNKEYNPFIFSDLQEYNPINIFYIIESLSDDFFIGNCSSTFEWNLSEIFNYKVEYNTEGLYILLTDWLSNMEKHGTDYQIDFRENSKQYIIIFSNKFDERENDTILKIESDFNLNDRTEIIRRKSHGIFQIKSTMEEMNLNGKIKINDGRIHFKLYFKKIKNMKYKVAIFENEIIEVEGVFEYLNFKDHFDGNLDYTFFVSSQSIKDFQDIKNYHLILVDISLSSNSELDGFALIEKIEKEISPTPKILIMTGQEISEGYEKEYGIKAHPFVEKPLSFEKLKAIFIELLTQ